MFSYYVYSFIYLVEVISLSVDLGNSIISTGASRIIQSIQCNLMLHSSINEAAKQVDGVNVSNSMHTLSSSTLHILRDVICDVWDVSVNLINAFFSATATETTDLELSNESSPTDDNEADALDVSKYSLSISCICSFLAQLRALVTLGHAFESFVSNPNKINDEMQNTAHADYLLVGKKIDETYYQLCSNKSVLRFIQTRRDVSYTLSSIYTLHLQHQCYNEGKHSNKTTFTDKIIALYTSQCDNKGTINTSRTFSQQVLFIQSLARAINHVAKVDVRFGVELIYSLGVCWLRSYGHDNVQSVFAETISWLQSDGILDSVLSFDYKYISYSLVSPLINACADTTRDLMIDTDQATVFYILRNLFKAIGVSNFWFQIHENDSILLKCRIFVDICFAVKNHLGNQSILHEASEMIKELTKLDIYTMFYHVLIKEVSSETTEDALISGVYEQALAELCSIGTSIGANMTAFHQLNEDEKFHGMIQKCLRSLVWDLGGTTPQITASLKAIRVLCTLEQAKAMSYQASSATAKGSQSSQEITPIVSTDLQENVAVSFNNNFLYVMANVIEFEWIKRTDEQRSQSVRALTRLITLLLATDVKKFLPKV